MAVVRIQLRRDTAANWTSADPILADGEMGLETDTGLVKIGDGTTAWTSLGYAIATYDLTLGFVGVPAASALDWALAPRVAVISAADPGSAYARTLPSAAWSFDIQVNGVSVGSVSISAAGVVNWTVGSDITLAAGDRLELVAPAAPDSTGADIQVAFKVFP